MVEKLYKGWKKVDGKVDTDPRKTDKAPLTPWVSSSKFTNWLLIEH